MSILNVENASASTFYVAQTTLRNVLGTKKLAELLSDRDAITDEMQVSDLCLLCYRHWFVICCENAVLYCSKFLMKSLTHGEWRLRGWKCEYWRLFWSINLYIIYATIAKMSASPTIIFRELWQQKQKHHVMPEPRLLSTVNNCCNLFSLLIGYSSWRRTECITCASWSCQYQWTNLLLHYSCVTCRHWMSLQDRTTTPTCSIYP